MAFFIISGVEGASCIAPDDSAVSVETRWSWVRFFAVLFADVVAFFGDSLRLFVDDDGVSQRVGSHVESGVTS